MAIIRRLNGHEMTLHPEARVAENAVLVGSVSLEEGASVWYGAVLRGDMGTIRVGKGSAVEDNCILHGAVTLGDNCIIGHGAILHHCTVGNGVLIGMGATVLSGAEIGEGSIVAAGALVTENKIIPPGSMVMGVPGKIVKQVPAEKQADTLNGVRTYRELALAQLEPVSAAKPE